MSHLCVLVCRVEDEQHPDQLTQLDRIDVPAVALAELQPESALDHLEQEALACGHAVMRRLVVSQWEEVDRALVVEHQRSSPPQPLAARRL